MSPAFLDCVAVDHCHNEGSVDFDMRKDKSDWAPLTPVGHTYLEPTATDRTPMADNECEMTWAVRC